MSHKAINITAPINKLGYGVASTNLLLALDRLGVEVSLWPIGPIEADVENHHFIKQAINNQQYYDPTAVSLRIWHQFDLAQHIGKGRHIGFPIFELDKFSDRERHSMACMDELFVPSKWAAQVVKQQELPCSTHVIPLGVDRGIFNETLCRKHTPDPHWTTFLNVGKWEYRKGHDVLIRAFSKAFTKKDRARLWLMTQNPFLSETQADYWRRLCEESPLRYLISVVCRTEHHYNVARIMATADCGVFPARAEGWNLEALEMLSLGKPIITTNYSGHTEFCNNANSMLINVTDMEVANDGVFFDGSFGGRWAKLGDDQEEELICHMRNVHKRRIEGDSLFNQNGVDTAKQYSWDNTAWYIKNLI
jgi:glycosyltransferase involved in cell wall biosynthesis